MSDLFPPFVPDPPEKTRRRSFKSVPFRVIAPNLITLLALCLGLTAIRLAFEGRLEPAIVAIFFAALLDGIDGRVARMLKGTSRFGAELDSLSDFVNFGVAPALILYSFILFHLKAIGWVVALVFAIASCLRLARFNVMLDDPNRPEWKKDFFVGMPAPMGAITALLPIYLHFVGVPMGAGMAPVALVYVLGMAIMMVSTVPTYSGKTVGKRIPRSYVLPIFVGAVALAALMASFPFEVLALGTLIYLALIPVGIARYRHFERLHGDTLAADTEPPAAAP